LCGCEKLSAVAELPAGTVTFLFTDVEGSTRLWEEHPDAMKPAMARHDAIVRVAIEGHAGHVVKTTGDGVHAVFAVAPNALAAAIDAQLALARTTGPCGPLRVRMGLHSGTAELRDGDYFGSAVNRAARLMSVAHGGQVVCSQATEELVAEDLSGEVTTRDLGVHRLRDLASPVHVWQVVHRELESEFPALNSLDAFGGNLPVQVTSFVGRDNDVSAIVNALGVSRVVTLTGTGGVGKTRLAIQAAAEIVDRFPDGAWLCELAGAGDGDDAMLVIAETLGVTQRAGMTLDESIVDALAPKHLLVVFDNCEHVLDATSGLISGLLRRCPSVRVLATSREGLGVPGEQVWPVRPLAVPEPTADPAAMRATPSVWLFAERAHEARPSFVLDDTNVHPVSDICRRVDGIPLAIELAAARVVALSPHDIAAKLDERFRLLRGGRRTTMERHQTIRATVEWSYSLLDTRDRLVFERLSVFMGGFDVSAAEGVAADAEVEAWDVVDALTSLVAKSMVVADEEPSGAVRYSMLETLRQYALERLAEHGDAALIYRRHAELFAEFAEQLGPELMGRNELVWRERLRPELDNLRSAVAWALDSDVDTDGELAVRIVAALSQEAVQEGSGGIASLATRALERARRSTNGRARAVLGAAAWAVFRYTSDFEHTIDLASEALERGVDGECPTPHLPYVAMGLALGFTGGIEGIRRLYDEAKRTLAAIDAPPFSNAFIQSSLAFAETAGSDLSRARIDAEEAVRLARAIGNPTQLADALYVFARSVRQVEPARARECLEESVALASTGAQGGTRAMTVGLLAELQAVDGDPAAAATLRDALRMCFAVRDIQTGTVADYGINVCAALARHQVAATIGGILAGAFEGTTTVSEGERHGRKRALDAAAGALGKDTFDAAYARGQSMTQDEASTWMLQVFEHLSEDLIAR
jgi:predicted ATPase/class 3 adenylate cyclase